MGTIASSPRRTPARVAAAVAAACGLLAAIPATAEIVIVGADAPVGEKEPQRPTPSTYGKFTATNPGAYNPDLGSKLTFMGRVFVAADALSGQGHNYGVHDYSSSIGFKGAFKLNDEFAVVWQNDNTLSNYDGTGTLGSRDTFIGIASKRLGALRVGRFQNPYDRHSVYGDMAADTQGLGITQVLWANCGTAPAFKGWTAANSCFDNKQANSLRFDSVDYGPFFGAVQFSSYSQGQSTANSIGGPHSISAAVTYRNFPFIASVGWEHHTRMTTINQRKTVDGVTTASLAANTSNGIAGSDDAFEIVGGYQVTPRFYVGGIYERLKYTTDTQGRSVHRDMLGLAMRYAYDKWLFETTFQRASNGKGSAASGVCAGNVCAGPDTGATHLTLGARYNFVPQTAVYLQLVRLANQANGSYSLKNYAVREPGVTSTGISLGFQHHF